MPKGDCRRAEVPIPSAEGVSLSHKSSLQVMVVKERRPKATISHTVDGFSISMMVNMLQMGIN